MDKDALKNKKIYVYGDERYIRDFLYVFEWIEADRIVDNGENFQTLSFLNSQEIEKNDAFVIVCKYDPQNTVSYLQGMKLKRNFDFCCAEEMFYMLDFPIREISEKRDIYVWGLGADGHTFFHSFMENYPDIRIKGFIDNDIKKADKLFSGYQIYRDEVLDCNNNDFVIISSRQYFLEIKSCLENKGMQLGRDFISYLEINNNASQMLRRTIYDMPRLDCLCRNFFDMLYVTSDEGQYFSCIGTKNEIGFRIPFKYTDFTRGWNSNISKIFRLSAVNGTYSFCDTGKCHLLRDCACQEKDVEDIHLRFFHLTESEIARIQAKPRNDINTVFSKDRYLIKAEDGPKEIQCAFDGTCNLYCITCRNKVYTADSEKRNRLRGFSKSLKEDIILPYIKRLRVAGNGEVLFSPTYHSLVFDEEIARSVEEIILVSNGSLLTKDMCDKILRFWNNRVSFVISMDAAKKDTAERLRRGVNFDIWLENMAYIAHRRRQSDIKRLSFNFVVQQDNYLEMRDFAEMCFELNADRIRFSMLQNRGTYTPEEYVDKSMFYYDGVMKPELQKVVEDEFFKDERIRMFQYWD